MNIISLLAIACVQQFLLVRVQHLFARGLKVTLLRYYLGINQLLIRGIPKKKFAVKGRGLVCCKHVLDNGRGVEMPMFELFVSKYQDSTVFLRGKRA